ncbi:tetraacyldisaccharide 4'-kinase [Mucilaginibacter hurinus]|uniref:Tetraacyldisaccharide 4'-kinase n=1 Tax=Mucilaginibacter hurinus TaxID=2201324 RepID=A0A367GUA3_9SPHI|nr:tetraacyldisaccharide 4'-kinase [Mucilaginibacter hurinus]RCH56778.1 tetraacyldisaccharide 4'-kinase [Mucilaginibacter hurinus]
MKILRLLLFPFSILYAAVTSIRNWLYDAGIFKSTEFNVPVISVGNLDVGGAGKSPMTEYLIRLLKNDYKIATLSRGYGRKTTGFINVGTSATATEAGDEPAQFKHKFPEITVAVCEGRVAGISRLLPQHELILLDDAYQHRAVKPGLSVLLFDYNRLNEPRWLLPAGNLREPFIGRWRADIIIISKCPDELSAEEKARIIARVKPFPFQQVFFTAINYRPLQNLQGDDVQTTININTTVYLLTGIANSTPLVQHIKKYTPTIIHHKYPDHHQFSLKNISKLAVEFSACSAQKKLLITTEKDAQRLGEQELMQQVKQLPFLVLPIGINFHDNGQQQFDELIINYVRKHTANNRIH